MLISYSHQFLFVHVPKTAGTSIVRCLRSYAHAPENYLVNRVLNRCGIHVNLLPGPHRWRRFRPHHSAATIRRHLPSQVFDRMFKFAFVRNPWDWLVSYYHFHLQCVQHHRHTYVRRLGNFAEFVRWQVERQSRHQVDFLTDQDGRFLVDYLGRFETLAEDFRDICLRLGIESELEWHNRSERGDYRTYYDDATAALVGEYFQPDIEAFGYTFDGTDADAAHSSADILKFPTAPESQTMPLEGGRSAA